MHILSIPAIYALEITPVCNNRCQGCSNIYADRRNAPAYLSFQGWRDLLSPFINEAVQIRLTGGEPSLHPEFFQIFEEVTSHDAWVTVFTNGRWRDPELFVERIRGRPKFSGLLVSLHGAFPSTHEAFSGVRGSFDETIENIKLAIENGITVALSTIITRYSWNELEAVVALGADIGVSHIAVNRYIGGPLPGIEPSEQQVRSAILSVQDMVQAGAPVKYGIGVPQCFIPNNSEGCLAGVAYVSIDPWGNLRPCAHSPTVVGSLRKKPIGELWHSSTMQHWRGLMPAECVTCAAYSACHGGCRAIQELRSDQRDPLRLKPLDEFLSAQAICELPADGRPRPMFRVRPENFGYALLGQGQVVPVSTEAHGLIGACDGFNSFAEIAARFGTSGLDLLGELWELGMLEVT